MKAVIESLKKVILILSMEIINFVNYLIHLISLILFIFPEIVE